MKKWLTKVGSLLLGLVLCLPVGVSAQSLGYTTTTLQNAAVVTGNGSTINTLGYATVSVDIVSTVTSYTIVPEILFVTGGTYRTATCYDLTGSSATSYTDTGVTNFRCNVVGAVNFRARISAMVVGAGSMTVVGRTVSGGNAVVGLPSNNAVFTGQALFADGTAAAPSIAFSSGPGYGFYRDSSGKITVSVNGVAGPATFGSIATVGLILRGDTPFGWNVDGNIAGNFAPDTLLFRDAANTLALRNGVNPQAFNIYNTYTDANNYERLKIGWASNVLTINAELLGTGVQRNIALQSVGGNVGVGTVTPTANFQVAQPTTGVGTVSVGAGGTAWTGVGTQFLNTFKVGDTITSAGQTLTIATITTDTALTTNAVGAAISAQAYTLVGGTRFSVFGNGNISNSGTVSSNLFTISGINNTFSVDSIGGVSLGYLSSGVNVNSQTLDYIGAITFSPSGTITVADGSTWVTDVIQFSKGSADAVSYAINCRKARGTVAAPTVITTGDDLCTMGGYGYVGATGTYVNAAQILFDSVGTIADTTSGMGGIIKFLTAKVGTVGVVESWRMDDSGHLVSTAVTAPTVNTCANGSVVGTDQAMLVSFTGANTSCSINVTAYTNAPVCFVGQKTVTATTVVDVVTATNLITITPSAAFANTDTVQVGCFGRI